MSLTGLITGRLLADPERRNGTSGKAFVRARLLASVDTEDGVLVSVAAFGSVADQLVELSKGDTISIAGQINPTASAKDGAVEVWLDLVAEQIMNVDHLRRMRAAMDGTATALPSSAGGRSNTWAESPVQLELELQSADEAWLQKMEVR